MGRTKVPDILKKKSVSLSLSQHIINALSTHENKAKVVEEILLENMDRIEHGDIAAAITAREIHIREMVCRALSENEGKFMENESNIKKLQEVVRTLQEVNKQSKVGQSELAGIAHEANKMISSMNTQSVRHELARDIIEKIYSDTEEYARTFFEV